MNRAKLDEIIEPYDEDSDDFGLGSIQRRAFVDGAEWLLRRPLSEKLSEGEIELIKSKYKFADVNYYEEQDSHKRDIYMAEKKLLESIFGKEMFKEE